MFARSRWQLCASFLFSAAVVAAQGSGCGSGSGGDAASVSSALSGSDAGSTDGAAPPPASSSCTAWSSSGITYSTTVDPMTLTATAQAGLLGAYTVRWTIAQAGATVLAGTARVANGSTTTQLVYGPAFQGIRQGLLTESGGYLSGSFDGRPFVPVALSTLSSVHDLVFADGAPPPALQASADTLAGLGNLLMASRKDAPKACASTTAGNTGLASAFAQLQAIVWDVPAGVQKPGPAPGAQPAGGGPSAPTPPAGPTPAGPSGPPAPNGGSVDPAQPVPPDWTGSTDQNNLIEWATHDCQGCERACAEDLWNYVVPFGLWLCEIKCFVPGQGCGENYCPVFGLGTCDDDQACCGSSCCGPGAVCGNDSIGTCCPADHPVGCGDQTAVLCYQAGTVCCGDGMQFGCPPNTVCTDIIVSYATCCLPDHATSSGHCCDQPLCGGECCPGGSTCIDNVCCGQGQTVCNGACCDGSCVNGSCCGGFGQVVCNGSCCSGSCCGGTCCPTAQGCTTQNTCCAVGETACGSVCCAAGTACADPSASRCTVPGQPLLEFWDPGTSTWTLGVETCKSTSGNTACEPEGWGTAFHVRGTGYVTGAITITATGPYGVETFTGVADSSGTFDTWITVTGYGSMFVPVTASETVNGAVLSATALATFNQTR
jgi:hypothetical protein